MAERHAVDGAKLAGILLERQGDAVVIGFGVNLAHHPEASGPRRDQPEGAAGTAPRPDAFAEIWPSRSPAGSTAGARRARADPVAWLAAAHPAGTPLSTQPTARVAGLFDGLDETARCGCAWRTAPRVSSTPATCS